MWLKCCFSNFAWCNLIIYETYIFQIFFEQVSQSFLGEDYFPELKMLSSPTHCHSFQRYESYNYFSFVIKAILRELLLFLNVGNPLKWNFNMLWISASSIDSFGCPYSTQHAVQNSGLYLQCLIKKTRVSPGHQSFHLKQKNIEHKF